MDGTEMTYKYSEGALTNSERGIQIKDLGTNSEETEWKKYIVK